MSLPSLNAGIALDEHADASDIGWDESVVNRLGMFSRHIALLAAWIATCGSLFFSEVLGWRPCVLCWYQRILMYPLAILLAIGIVRRDRGLHTYVLPFSIAGLGVALYHHLLIKTDWLPPPACVADVPCTVDYLNWLGFITIPWLALTAFAIITGMLLLYAWTQTPDDLDNSAVSTEQQSQSAAASRFDTATLAAGMIIVAVILVFLVGSTFV